MRTARERTRNRRRQLTVLPRPITPRRRGVRERTQCPRSYRGGCHRDTRRGHRAIQSGAAGRTPRLCRQSATPFRTPNECRVMPGPGIEPGWGYPHKILSLARLPISPPRRDHTSDAAPRRSPLKTQNGSGVAAPAYVSATQRVALAPAVPVQSHSFKPVVRERETGLEPATPTLARLCSTN